MDFDKALVAAKLRRWESYINSFRLPMWKDIPDFGLYMEQVILLLQEYLDYLPPDIKEEQFITAATINNYVRKKVMPEPVKKKYYRRHIAYLIVICTLKHSLTIATVQAILPPDLEDAALAPFYDAYAERHHRTTEYFTGMCRTFAGSILGHQDSSPYAVQEPVDLIFSSAIISEFSRVLAEKLLLLDGKALPTDEAAGEETT